jgi:hypothetical protein
LPSSGLKTGARPELAFWKAVRVAVRLADQRVQTVPLTGVEVPGDLLVVQDPLATLDPRFVGLLVAHLPVVGVVPEVETAALGRLDAEVTVVLPRGLHSLLTGVAHLDRRLQLADALLVLLELRVVFVERVGVRLVLVGRPALLGEVLIGRVHQVEQLALPRCQLLQFVHQYPAFISSSRCARIVASRRAASST